MVNRRDEVILGNKRKKENPQVCSTDDLMRDDTQKNARIKAGKLNPFSYSDVLKIISQFKSS